MLFHTIDYNNYTFDDFYKSYGYNSSLMGEVNINEELFNHYVKLMCIFPLNLKEYKIYIKLNPNQKAGYLSRYIMKIARNLNVPNVYIQNLFNLKKKFKETKINYRIEDIKEKIYNNKYSEILDDYYNIKQYENLKKDLLDKHIELIEAIYQQYENFLNNEANKTDISQKQI